MLKLFYYFIALITTIDLCKLHAWMNTIKVFVLDLSPTQIILEDICFLNAKHTLWWIAVPQCSLWLQWQILINEHHYMVANVCSVMMFTTPISICTKQWALWQALVVTFTTLFLLFIHRHECVYSIVSSHIKRQVRIVWE